MVGPRTTFARRQRQDSGRAESHVWACLRGAKIDGHKFRREHPIGRYVADFACDQFRLILEIDGGIHTVDEVATKDHLRQIELEASGWTVLRFTNDEALLEPEKITVAIRAHAKNIGL